MLWLIGVCVCYTRLLCFCRLPNGELLCGPAPDHTLWGSPSQLHWGITEVEHCSPSTRVLTVVPRNRADIGKWWWVEWIHRTFNKESFLRTWDNQTTSAWCLLRRLLLHLYRTYREWWWRWWRGLRVQQPPNTISDEDPTWGMLHHRWFVHTDTFVWDFAEDHTRRWRQHLWEMTHAVFSSLQASVRQVGICVCPLWH